MMFDMKDPDNQKAFLTGVVLGESLKEREKPARSDSGGGGGSAIGYLIGIVLSVVIIVAAYIVLMD